MELALRSAHPVDADGRDVAAARAGDRAAFERLYRATVARVHTLARRILGASEADDATQEVYVRAWSGLARFRGEARFSTWLWRLALNVILSRREHLTREAHLRADEVELAGVADPGRASAARTAELETAIERLPDAARAVFVLHDVEELAHEEVAAVLGIAVGTSKSQLHRARELLRGYLTERGRS